MKDTLRILANNPEIGVSWTCLSTIISYSNYFNPLLTFISLSIAIIIGLMTLYGKVKG
jgi:xanthine/uracil permease